MHRKDASGTFVGADGSFRLQAQTGFPWIDAIMTQLRQEGWIHHLARHAVACFLTRGDLWISWEEGMKVRRGLTPEDNQVPRSHSLTVLPPPGREPEE